MRAAVICRKKLGKRIPHHLVSRAVPITGDLRVTEERNREMHRLLVVARLFDFTQKPPEVLPPLYDATVLQIKESLMVVTGIEVIGEVDFSQTWFCALG